MTLIRTIPRPSGCDGVAVVAFSRDGQLLATGGCGVQLFRVSDGMLVQALNGSAPASRSVAFSPDRQTIAAGSAFTDAYSGQCVDCTIKLWRLSDGALLQTIDGNNNGINSIAFAPDGQFIIDGSSERTYSGVVRLWRLSDGMLVRYFNQDPSNVYSFINSVAYSPKGKLFAYARGDFRVVVATAPDPFGSR
jgi:WD40 repeat protein